MPSRDEAGAAAAAALAASAVDEGSDVEGIEAINSDEECEAEPGGRPLAAGDMFSSAVSTSHPPTTTSQAMDDGQAIDGDGSAVAGVVPL